MNRCQPLMNAEEDEGQKCPAQNKARESTAFVDRCRCRRAYRFREKISQRLTNADSNNSGYDDNQKRCQKECEHVGNDALQLLFQCCREETEQEDGNNAATSRCKLFSEKGDICQGGMADDCRQDTA